MTSKEDYVASHLDLDTPIFGLPLTKEEMLHSLTSMPDAEEIEDATYNPFIIRTLEANRFIFSAVLTESYFKPNEQLIDEITPNVVRLSSKTKQIILGDIQEQQAKLQKLLIKTLAPLLLSIDSAMVISAETLSQTLNTTIENTDIQSTKMQEIVRQASILKFIEHVSKTLHLNSTSKQLLIATYINNISKSSSTDVRSLLSSLKDVYSAGERSGKTKSRRLS